MIKLEIKILVHKSIKPGFDYYIGKNVQVSVDIFDINEDGFNVLLNMGKDWKYEDFHKLIGEAITKLKDLPAEIFITSITPIAPKNRLDVN